jgi:hypothetical protein
VGKIVSTLPQIKTTAMNGSDNHSSFVEYYALPSNKNKQG